MERIKKRGGGGGNELASVKAAAWAWYELGTGLEGMSLPEFDIRRSFHDPKPSRFKLEAKKSAKQGSKDINDGLSTGTSSGSTVQTVNGPSLLDRFEIESISRRFNQLIASKGDKATVYNEGFLAGDGLAKLYDHDGSDPGCSSASTPQRKLRALMTAIRDLGRKESVALSEGDYANRRSKKKSNSFSLRGLWQRQAVVCGSTAHNDVVLATRSFVDKQKRHQYSENRKVYSPVPVVKFANCRPKAADRHTGLLIN